MAKKTAPKKSSAKKKASVPKKKAVAKTVKKTSKPGIVEEAASAMYSTSSPEAPYTPEPVSAKQEGKKFPLVVIVLLVIGVIVFLNYLNKKKAASQETPTAVTEEAGKSKEKPEPEMGAAFNMGDWDKAVAGAQNWSDANGACEKKGMKLPSKEELEMYRKNASKESENMGRLWTSTADGKEYVTVYMKSGSSSSRAKNKKYKFICKK